MKVSLHDSIEESPDIHNTQTMSALERVWNISLTYQTSNIKFIAKIMNLSSILSIDLYFVDFVDYHLVGMRTPPTLLSLITPPMAVTLSLSLGLEVL